MGWALRIAQQDCNPRFFAGIVCPVKDSNSLCLQCGLCCNGAIFGDVKLQPGDNPRRLKQLGLPLLSGRRSDTARFTQPCSAFQNGLCQIYSERPEHCRHFECLLLKRVKAGEVEAAAALRTVDDARERIARVCGFLNELGDNDERVTLKTRVQRANRRLEKCVPTPRTADLFGQLTLAFHDLNLLLSESFWA